MRDALLLLIFANCVLMAPATARDLPLDDIGLKAPDTADSSRFTVRWNNTANARLGEMQYLEESRDGGHYYTVYSGLGGTKTFMNKRAGQYSYRVRWQFCFATYCHSLYSDSVQVTIEAS
ncbi:MAG: hypothetical protein AAGA33_03840 [Pseudomonadota bacterium]